MIKNITLLLAALLLPLSAHALDKGIINIKSGQKEYRFQVEIARTAEERSRGLMFRSNLAADAGMIFVFPDEPSVSFWMKNTLIPLDMLFIGRDGTILQIAKNAEPLSERPISSLGPVYAVLEINGGLSDQLAIKPGDKTLLP